MTNYVRLQSIYTILFLLYEKFFGKSLYIRRYKVMPLTRAEVLRYKTKQLTKRIGL